MAKPDIRCAIVGEKRVEDLMLRYLGQAPPLTRTDTELLLMALYLESCAHGGVATKALAIMDRRLAAMNARVRLPPAPFNLSDEEIGKEWERGK